MSSKKSWTELIAVRQIQKKKIVALLKNLLYNRCIRKFC